MKVAFIGTGWVAGRHLQGLIHEPGVEIVGHVGPTAAKREAAVEKWGGRPYADTAALLNGESVDAVWVCVPPHQHGEIEYQLIDRGIPFMVEKPLSANRATGAEIGVAIDRVGLIAAVGYHWRGNDLLPQVRAALTQHPVRMVTGRWHGSTPPPAWWHSQSSSGGQMVEQATHLVDLARHLLGDAHVKAASGAHHRRPQFPDLDVDLVSAALLEFPGDIVGVFSATCVLNHSGAVDLQLLCEGMQIIIQGNSVIFDDGRERREVPYGIDPFVAENRAFLRAVETGDTSGLLCSYADALVTHHLCHDILDAMR